MRPAWPLAVLLLLTGAPVHADWVRVDTPNFVLVGEVGERRARDYAFELERFGEALSSAMTAAAAPLAAPLVVVLFADHQSYRPYALHPDALAGGGHLVTTESENMIALVAGNDGFRGLYHEYVHAVTANAGPPLPLWLAEGLAEYYSQFRIDAPGRASFGLVDPVYSGTLARHGLLAPDEFLRAQSSSPVYTSPKSRPVFYAQAWAAVHMLQSGAPGDSSRIDRYAHLIASGHDPVEAWRELFGDADLRGRLKKYLSSPRLHGYSFDFTGRVRREMLTVERLTPDEAAGVLDRLDWHVGRLKGLPPAASPRATSSQSPLAMALRQRTGEWTDDDPRQTERTLADIGRRSSDWLVHYHLAVALEDVRLRAPFDRADEIGAAALRSIDHVLAARPGLPHAMAVKARLLGPTDEAIALISRARKAVPGRHAYTIQQARLHAMRGERDAARALFTLARQWPDTRAQADEDLRHLAEVEKTRAALPSIEPPLPADPAPETKSRTLPLLREPRPGERRLEGRLDRIDCGSVGPVVIHILADSRRWRFTAARLEDIDFISYRSETAAAVSCGRRPVGGRVLATWRRAAGPEGLDGRLVAIELLPGSGAGVRR